MVRLEEIDTRVFRANRKPGMALKRRDATERWRFKRHDQRKFNRHETTAAGLPQFAHLRLTMPVPEYLLAMKCMAARIGGTAD